MSDENPPEKLATLDYATPQPSDALEWVPEAERLIDAKYPPIAIRHLFRSATDALDYFARSMSRRCGPESLGDVCFGCGRPAQDPVVKIHWVAECRARMFEYRLTGWSALRGFSTFHPLCRPCLRELIRRINDYAWPRRGLWRASWVVLIAFFASLAWAMAFSRDDEPLIGVAVLIALFLALVAMRRIVGLVWWYHLPAWIRRLMHRSVRLIELRDVFRRVDGQLHVWSE